MRQTQSAFHALIGQRSNVSGSGAHSLAQRNNSLQRRRFSSRDIEAFAGLVDGSARVATRARRFASSRGTMCY